MVELRPKQKFSKSLVKSQVAQMLDISPGTLRYYLNVRYYQQLSELGYRKTQIILTPQILNFLVDKLGLDPD